MKERPILMTATNVIGLLEDRKSQTRRTNSLEEMSEKPHWHYAGMSRNDEILHAQFDNGKTIHNVKCPFGFEGHRLWVRETFAAPWGFDYKFPSGESGIFYRADNPAKFPDDGSWKPSIFMPRKASRITLEITSVRVERLNDISDEDAKAEGCPDRTGFMELWESINGFESWEKNPFVWAITFKRIKPMTHKPILWTEEKEVG
jgi:hypothetical protein